MAKGIKTGGRKKGVKNKSASIAALKSTLIVASGLTPLEYLLQVLRDENIARPERVEAAKAAAPYVHPKLAQITHKGDQDQPLIPSRIEVVIVGSTD